MPTLSELRERPGTNQPPRGYGAPFLQPQTRTLTDMATFSEAAAEPAGDDAGIDASLESAVPGPRAVVLQRWEGTVEEVTETTFAGVLQARSDDAPDEWVELHLDDVAEDERSLVVPGAVFTWSIGYQDSEAGRTRESTIRIRRRPGFTEAEIAAALDRASRRRRAWGIADDAGDG
ncbi:MAG: hypothetical protein WD250_15870 [Egibacteraceae bacterium]